jgi:hypothetical protein
MSEMPARIWAEDTRDGAWFGHPRSAYAVEYIRSDIAERMAEALKNWLKWAEDNLSEFDQPGECSAEHLCPRCHYNGCIKQKFDDARSALSAWKDGR